MWDFIQSIMQIEFVEMLFKILLISFLAGLIGYEEKHGVNLPDLEHIY